jgi:hypothetical protein
LQEGKERRPVGFFQSPRSLIESAAAQALLLFRTGVYPAVMNFEIKVEDDPS